MSLKRLLLEAAIVGLLLVVSHSVAPHSRARLRRGLCFFRDVRKSKRKSLMLFLLLKVLEQLVLGHRRRLMEQVRVLLLVLLQL